VRVALAAGLDRNAVIERAMPNAAVTADSPLMPGSWAYESELPWPVYDPARARELLEQAAERINRIDGDDETAAVPPPSDQVAPGAEPTATFTPAPPPENLLTFSILVPDDPSLTSVAQEIAAQWSQLGIAVTVNAVPVDIYQQRLDGGDFDTAIVEYSLGDSADPDVYGFWHQGQYPDGENYGGVDDLRISVLLERARRDSWGINRAEDYAQFQREFAERVIALPLYYPIFTYVTSAHVNGIQLGFLGTPADRFRNIEEWSLAN
jgi:peptide/nickel transport system substrate-binding protein